MFEWKFVIDCTITHLDVSIKLNTKKKDSNNLPNLKKLSSSDSGGIQCANEESFNGQLFYVISLQSINKPYCN